VLGPSKAARGYKVGGTMGLRGAAARPPANGPGTFLACSHATRL